MHDPPSPINEFEPARLFRWHLLLGGETGYVTAVFVYATVSDLLNNRAAESHTRSHSVHWKNDHRAKTIHRWDALSVEFFWGMCASNDTRPDTHLFLFPFLIQGRVGGLPFV